MSGASFRGGDRGWPSIAHYGQAIFRDAKARRKTLIVIWDIFRVGIGRLIELDASISGAEFGCQGVGRTAGASGAAGFAAAMATRHRPLAHAR